MITGKVSAIGNSNAIRIPKAILEAMSLKSGDSVTMELSKEGLIVRKKWREKEYPSIDDLFKNYTGDFRPDEFLADDGVGKELI